MGSLHYREDMDAVRSRLTTWWTGGDIGRPALNMTVQREDPVEVIAKMPEPDGWVTRYSTMDFDYRVNLAARECIYTDYVCEGVPNVSPDLGPGCLSLYLGCTCREMPGTVWFESCIDDVTSARFALDPENFYWQYTLRLTDAFLKIGRGKFLLQFPDLIEGLDTLAAMRGTEPLLIDLLERPEWVQNALSQVNARYFECYDVLYELMKDETGGSVFWAWAPGRMAKLQCDFSAMISPEMFKELMVPVLTSQTERFDFCMYHWDGPEAIPHHDHLLSVPGLSMIQWTPGAGAAPGMDREWWPLYHKTIEAGKKMFVFGYAGADAMRAMKREFGDKLKQFMFRLNVETHRDVEEILGIVSD